MNTPAFFREHARIPTALALILLAAGCTGDGAPAGPLPYNFDVLEPGRAYRSSQPTGEQLENIISEYGIRTVVNLRGDNPGSGWYDAEQQVCDSAGIALVSHPMSAKSLPSGEVLEQVTQTLITAEYPILIHCQGGADRSGAVSAIYRMLIMGDSREAALSELSIAHLHFRASTPCMDTLAELYEPTPEWMAWYAANMHTIECR